MALACSTTIRDVGAQSAAGNAMLRIACDEDAQNADVFVNGEFKGQCSVDIPVAGAALQVRVVKAIDGLTERIFEQAIRMAPNTVKRVDVVLGPKQPSERGRQLALDQARQAEVVRQRAEAGEVAAMLDLARRYEIGQDFPKTPALAHQWTQRAADTGNLDAQYQLAKQFENGIGVVKNIDQASAIYLKCANLKNENCINAVSAIERMNSRSNADRVQRCDSGCRQIPEINKCVEDAKNFLGDTMVWSMGPRQACINNAYAKCMSSCDWAKGRGRIGISLSSGNSPGAAVTAVLRGSPAEQAGLLIGDVIIKFDGKVVESSNAFTEMVGAALIGANRTVTISRQGREIELNVTIVRIE